MGARKERPLVQRLGFAQATLGCLGSLQGAGARLFRQGPRWLGSCPGCGAVGVHEPLGQLEVSQAHRVRFLGVQGPGLMECELQALGLAAHGRGHSLGHVSFHAKELLHRPVADHRARSFDLGGFRGHELGGHAHARVRLGPCAQDLYAAGHENVRAEQRGGGGLRGHRLGREHRVDLAPLQDRDPLHGRELGAHSFGHGQAEPRAGVRALQIQHSHAHSSA